MVEPVTYSAALAGMVDRPFLASEKYRLQQQRANRDLAHATVLEFERVFVRRMAKLGVPVFSPEIWRSAKRQDDLFALGNSKAKGGQSAHQYGLAIDLVHSVKGWNLSKKQWEVMLHTGREIVLSTGLKMDNLADLTNGFDPAHWQLKNWKQFKDPNTW